MQIEGQYLNSRIRCPKFYLLSHDIQPENDSSISHSGKKVIKAKSVYKAIAQRLHPLTFTLDPAVNNQKTTRKKMHTSIEEDSVFLIDEIRKLCHAWNFTRTALNPVHSISFI